MIFFTSSLPRSLSTNKSWPVLGAVHVVPGTFSSHLHLFSFDQLQSHLPSLFGTSSLRLPLGHTYIFLSVLYDVYIPLDVTSRRHQPTIQGDIEAWNNLAWIQRELPLVYSIHYTTHPGLYTRSQRLYPRHIPFHFFSGHVDRAPTVATTHLPLQRC